MTVPAAPEHRGDVHVVMDVTATVERGVGVTDSALADQVTRRQLGALADLTEKQRNRLTETFGAWLETRGTAAEIADRLCVHPQTVRYRMRQLERTFGDQFGDPDARFAMEMVLRVIRLRERASRTSELAP